MKELSELTSFITKKNIYNFHIIGDSVKIPLTFPLTLRSSIKILDTFVSEQKIPLKKMSYSSASIDLSFAT